ncbi:hypothetical protein V6N11_070183 [Hibiscus sabdariffa]|uniref:Uncharacterized protein n=1 Tax=Hibiscus sabdariffa TaxID=183260 RepID=A0ABR2QEP6_9ROSI
MLDKAKSPREQRSSQTQSVHAAIVRTRRLTLPKGWLLLDRKYFNRCVSKTGTFEGAYSNVAFRLAVVKSVPKQYDKKGKKMSLKKHKNGGKFHLPSKVYRKEAFPATCEKDKLQSKLALGNAPGARLTNLYFAAWNSSSKLYCKS